MKVSVVNINKPLPFPFGAIAAGATGAFGVVGAGIQGEYAKRQQERQIQHDKDMAALNQQNVLAQMAQGQQYDLAKMAQQNQYQLDQWNRENEYNDPSAVAARYRAAGINPRAAFGTGSASGAGIAGGLSSAPSGGAPSGSSTGSASNIMTQAPSALSSLGKDIADAFMEGRVADANVSKLNAETTEQLIENEYKEQNLVADLLIKRGEYEKLAADKELSESQKAHYRKLIEGVDQQIAESQERTKGYEVQRDSVKAQTENTKVSTNQIAEDIKLKKVLRQKENALIDNITADTGVKEKEVEKIAVDIYHTYVKMGLDASTALKNVNDIITDWVPAPGKLVKKITQIVHKKSK